MTNVNTILNLKFLKLPRRIVLLTLFTITVHGSYSSLEAAETANLEEKTKAAFIYHFTKYIKWLRADSSETFNIGVLGESRIIEPLKEISNLKRVGNKRIVIQQLSSVQQCNPCHIIFIADAEENKFEKIRAHLKGASTLTITDVKGFGKNGSCINFITRKGKLRFEINLNSLNQMNLTASSQLLKLAIIINGEDADD